ncbi:uncharacterized protein LOC118269258 isoform X2 [Spodoptera frugiperda]|uniref:Uncharacterized protein LOC118269258 isoform X2 n=1 Tax=Spodoptera frugiperda TaxID=7108 RepID=A0A9R0F3X5_SPOFR|nr:uncharacterized protein LOC118269258 isoform X2 [Spodoptera frugiperda]
MWIRVVIVAIIIIRVHAASNSEGFVRPHQRKCNFSDECTDEKYHKYNILNTSKNNAGSKNNKADIQVYHSGLINNEVDPPINNSESINNEAPINTSASKNHKTNSPVNNSGPMNNETHSPVNNSGSKNNEAHSPVNNFGSKNNEAHSPVNNFGSKNNEAQSPVNNFGSKNNEAHSPVNNFGSKNNEAQSPVNNSGSKNNETHSPVNNSGSMNNEAYSPVNNFGSKNNESHSPINKSGSKKNRTHKPVNNSGSKNNEAHSPINNSGSKKNRTHKPVNNSGSKNNEAHSPVNNSEPINNEAHSPINTSASKNHKTNSPVNNSGPMNNEAHSPVNNFGSKNNEAHSPINKSGSKNNEAHSPINNAGSKNNKADIQVYYSELMNNEVELQVNNSEPINNEAHSPINTSASKNHKTNSPVNNSGPMNNEAHSPVNNFGSKNNEAHSPVNNFGSKNNEAHSPVNNFGSKNNEAQSPVNNSGSKNNETHSPVNNSGSMNNEAHLPVKRRVKKGLLPYYIILHSLSYDPSKTDSRSKENSISTEMGIRRKKGPLYYNETTRLCPNGTVCPRKCCNIGKNFDLSNQKCSRAEHSQFDSLIIPIWKVKEYDKLKKNVQYSIGHRLTCLRELKEERTLVTDITTEFWLTSDGKLEVETPLVIGPQLTYNTDKYCIDIFTYNQNITRINAFICHVNEEIETYDLILTGSCYLITSFFVILRVSVIAWLPELRTLHGLTIVAYLGNFVVSYTLLGIEKLLMLVQHIKRDTCVVFNFIIYFGIMSAFFWRNVLCFDMWKAFSGKRIIPRNNPILLPRLRAYFAYAYGVPAGLTIILIAMEYSDISDPYSLKPNLRLKGCASLSGNGALLYHFIPLITLFIANIVMFTSTALKIAATTKQTKILYESQNNAINTINTERRRFLLYVKLWAAMLILEVNWIVRAVVRFFPGLEIIILIVDVYNTFVLLGIIIHYFCQKRNWEKFKKRYQLMRGISVSEQNSTGQLSNRTTSTSSVSGMGSQISVWTTVTSASTTAASDYELNPLSLVRTRNIGQDIGRCRTTLGDIGRHCHSIVETVLCRAVNNVAAMSSDVAQRRPTSPDVSGDTCCSTNVHSGNEITNSNRYLDNITK